jgi:glyceraldehyde 3-phosphate dehydrogenase
MIPTTTGAAKAVSLVIPELKGKLNGYAMRVPTPNVSVVDLALDVDKNCTVEEVNAVLKTASNTARLKNIMAYTDEPLVSSDFNHTAVSGTVDGLSTMVIDGNMVKILAWYDNEWGYSNRVLDLVAYVAKVKRESLAAK